MLNGSNFIPTQRRNAVAVMTPFSATLHPSVSGIIQDWQERNFGKLLAGHHGGALQRREGREHLILFLEVLLKPESALTSVSVDEDSSLCYLQPLV